MGYRNPNPRLAKIHRSYSVDDVSRLFKIHKNTVRNWLRQGLEPIDDQRPTLRSKFHLGTANGDKVMSLGLILVIILIIFLLGGFSGRFGGYGYGFGHGGIGVIGIVLIVLVVLLLMGRL